jgi:hypothetical protein
MSFGGKWLELEVMMLTGINQMKKDNYHVFCHMWKLGGKKTKDDVEVVKRLVRMVGGVVGRIQIIKGQCMHIWKCNSEIY